MKVYIVRHGETMVNASNKLQGRINCGLTEDGLKQCIELRKKFEDKNIDLIISSPLDRCKQTSEALSNGNIPIIYTEFVKKGLISLNRFLDILVYNPIKVFNLPKRDLKEGMIADIAIIDIENEHKYTKEEILSKGKNSPFIILDEPTAMLDKAYYGFNKCTLANGKIVYKK